MLGWVENEEREDGMQRVILFLFRTTELMVLVELAGWLMPGSRGCFRSEQ